MPTPPPCWWHLILNARGTWLPGDPRGFRSRNHRKHSSGDYKSPPPAGEHAGLQRVIAANSRPPVGSPEDLFPVLGKALLRKAREQEHEMLALSVDHHHTHALAKLPNDRGTVTRIVGTWKQHASHAVRDRLPGRIWASSGDPVRVTDREHQLNVLNYIVRHGNQDAWVWTFRDG